MPKNIKDDDLCKSCSDKATQDNDISIAQKVKIKFLTENTQMKFYYSELNDYSINNLHKKYEEVINQMYMKSRRTLITFIIIILSLFLLINAYIFLFRQPLINIYNLEYTSVFSIVITMLSLIFVRSEIDDFKALKKSKEYFENCNCLTIENNKNKNLKPIILRMFI